jgi:hypothetical protein
MNDIPKPDFLMIPRPVFEDATLQSADLLIYAVVYWYQHMVAKKCIASNARIGQIIGVAPHTVANGLDRLEKSGHIKRYYKDSTHRKRTEVKALVHFRRGVSLNRDTSVSLNREQIRISTSKEKGSFKNKTGKPVNKYEDLFKFPAKP